MKKLITQFFAQLLIFIIDETFRVLSSVNLLGMRFRITKIFSAWAIELLESSS